MVFTQMDTTLDKTTTMEFGRMSGKVLSFEIPSTIKRYQDPQDIFIDLDDFEFDLKSTLGPIGAMIQEHKFLVLNSVNYADFSKPYSEWTGITKHHVMEQMESFNRTLGQKIKDVPVVLIGGESAILKSGRFILRDIRDERQEVARVVGIISEVLFFEGAVYHRDSLSWMKVEDYQIKKAIFPRIRNE